MKTGSILQEFNGLGLHGIQIIQDGKELFCAEKNPGARQNQYSITKSITSAAVGFAVSEGLFSLEDPVDYYFKEWESNLGSYGKDLKIKHLLTMTLGMESPVLMGDERVRMRGEDWISYVCRQPILWEPGSRFQYNNGGPYLLGVLIQKLTGMDLAVYLMPRLFEPLGITKPNAERCSRGFVFGAGGMELSVKDVGKFGLLYLQKGCWEKKQLLSRDWILASLSYQVTFRQKKNGADGYGYLFWLLPDGSAMAVGKYGQYCILVPKKHAVITVNAMEQQREERILQILQEKIIPRL